MMTISCAAITLQAMALQAEHQAILRDVLVACGLWSGTDSSDCQGFITELGRYFQVVYQAAESAGSQAQSAGSNVASTESAIGPSWT
jgi:hypothetical protein